MEAELKLLIQVVKDFTFHKVGSQNSLEQKDNSGSNLTK